jgi:hypothetical protein
VGMKDDTHKGSQPEAEHKPAAQSPDAARAAEAEIRRLKAELAARDQELAAEREANAELAAIAPMQPLADPPEYEILGPNSFFSKDCVLYPPGSVIRDTFGTIVPNEEMLPLNEAAEERMDAYLATLPGGGTPPLDAVIEAAYQANLIAVTIRAPRLHFTPKFSRTLCWQNTAPRAGCRRSQVQRCSHKGRRGRSSTRTCPSWAVCASSRRITATPSAQRAALECMIRCQPSGAEQVR